MPQKIFISYRREDTAANALGEFGRKNVFIDVDMRAGTKFPVVLEQRLAECKVMIALIGPDWLNSRDEEGQRRLDNSDDWVRLEIAHALKKGVTVIPLRVNGTALPVKATLPADIQGLLDHQAVSCRSGPPPLPLITPHTPRQGVEGKRRMQQMRVDEVKTARRGDRVVPARSHALEESAGTP